MGLVSWGGWHSLPNHAVEPTPTAFARASLRLLARLTASVRLFQLVPHSRQMPRRRHPTPVLVPPTDAGRRSLYRQPIHHDMGG